MPFVEFTLSGSVKALINTDHILFAEPNGTRAKLNWVNGGHLHVGESYEQVREQLPQYTVLSVEESITPEEAANGLYDAVTQMFRAAEGNTTEVVNQDQQAADLEKARRDAEEVAKTEAQLAAEAAKLADASNPAKKRETKNP